MMISKRNIVAAFSVAVIGAAVLLTWQLLSLRSGNFTVIDPKATRPHIDSFRSLPEGYYHAGRYLMYKGKIDTDVKSIARTVLQFTEYYKIGKLEKAISDFNGLKTGNIAQGMPVYIPHPVPPVIPDAKNRIKSPIIFTRGLYYTGSNAGSEKLLSNLDSYIEAGINTVVFDAKDVTGIVNYNSRVPEVQDIGTHRKRAIDDVDKLIRALRSRGIYVIARLAVFRDQLLAKQLPEYAIRSKSTGKLWNEKSGEIWCDPSNRDTQDYNLAIAIELAEKGVDEIQLDYIRFPTGKSEDARYQWSFGEMPRDKAIEHFLARAYKEISYRNVNLSIDVFGVVAWGHHGDIMSTGQRIELLAKYCDVISPMLYPSHFNDNFDGYSKPGDEPYYFINAGCIKFREKAGSTIIRPWLQAFGWKVSNYNERYIIDQISGSNNAKAHGYLFWNAGNNYDTVLKALRTMKQTSKNASNPVKKGKENL